MFQFYSFPLYKNKIVPGILPLVRLEDSHLYLERSDSHTSFAGIRKNKTAFLLNRIPIENKVLSEEKKRTRIGHCCKTFPLLLIFYIAMRKIPLFSFPFRNLQIFIVTLAKPMNGRYLMSEMPL